jgi:hypothetical protein
MSLTRASASVIKTEEIVGTRNRIINGAMEIDQRNAGAAVTVDQGVRTFAVDRTFGIGVSAAGVFTVQQSTTVPAGFINSLVSTVTTTATPGTSEIYQLTQNIEGLNISDLGWGTANAKTVTLSFWVRSSVTGTFGGALRNSTPNRSYPFSYTISSANTWEQKSITIPGDTTGTWATDNGIGIRLGFSLGAGATLSGTAGAWAAGDFRSVTGSTNLMATNGATFHLTGVQLEVGSTATPFERRQFGTELTLCQRYYQKYSNASAGASAVFTIAQAYTTTAVLGAFVPSVSFRATPTINGVGYATWTASAGAGGGTSLSLAASSNTNFLRVEVGGASGLVAGNASGIQLSAGTTNYIDLSAEL